MEYRRTRTRTRKERSADGWEWEGADGGRRADVRERGEVRGRAPRYGMQGSCTLFMNSRSRCRLFSSEKSSTRSSSFDRSFLPSACTQRHERVTVHTVTVTESAPSQRTRRQRHAMQHAGTRACPQIGAAPSSCTRTRTCSSTSFSD